MIVYQRHNNKNGHLTRPREGPGLNALVSTYSDPRKIVCATYYYPRSSNKQVLLWKISSADN